MESNYTKLASLDVTKHIERKNNLSYLSWAWAVDALLRSDPKANWAFHEPVRYGETMMVSCTVTAFDKPMTMHLPVMDHRNQAVKNPDAVVINKNMMRCLVKAIACHGIGLHIYAGEDLPLDEDGNPARPAAKAKDRPLGRLDPDAVAGHILAMEAAASDLDALKAAFEVGFKACRAVNDPESEARLTRTKNRLRDALMVSA